MTDLIFHLLCPKCAPTARRSDRKVPKQIQGLVPRDTDPKGLISSLEMGETPTLDTLKIHLHVGLGQLV